jgi:hypothetical protein
MERERERESDSVLASLNPSPEDVVSLSLRNGQTLSVGLGVLRSRSSSLLAKMFSPPHFARLHRTPNGDVIIDCDPDAFLHVLHWLETRAAPSWLSEREKRYLMYLSKRLSLDELVGQLHELGVFDSDADEEERERGRDSGKESEKSEREKGKGERKVSGQRVTQEMLAHFMQISNCAAGGRLCLPHSDLNGLYLAGFRFPPSIPSFLPLSFRDPFLFLISQHTTHPHYNPLWQAEGLKGRCSQAHLSSARTWERPC